LKGARRTLEIGLLDELIEVQAQNLKHQAEMLVAHKVLLQAHQMVRVFRIVLLVELKGRG
jgi:hypothetical protein